MNLVAARVSGERAVDPLHVRHAADGAYPAAQMLSVAHLKLESERGAVHVPLLERYLVDIGLRPRDARRPCREHPDAIVDIELDLGAEQLALRPFPAHRQPLIRLLAVFGE